jgi:hypothetical protein
MQQALEQPLISAIKNDDHEALIECLNTATDVEKMNAALFAAYSDKITLLEPLIASGANINQADRGGVTCLHWAVCRHNLPMMKLLLQHGAAHQADKEGNTPADYAEENGYTDAFNLLVQHFLISPIKPHDQDESINDDIVLEEIDVAQVGSKQQISAKTLKLLLEFQIKKSDMDLVGIELKDIEHATNPSLLGKLLRLVVSSSLTKTLLQWPFLSKSNIPWFERPITSNTLTDSIVSESDEGRLSTFAEEMIETEALSQEETEDKDKEPLIQEADNTDHPIRTLSLQTDNSIDTLPEMRESYSCSMPILTSSAVLLGSNHSVRNVAGISAFHETTQQFIDGLWSGFLSSLLIHAIYNFYQYPEEREGADLWNVLGFGSIVNMFCIRSVDFFRDALCFGGAKQGYEEVLAASLDSPYIWPFLAGIPVLFGVINGIRAARDTKALKTSDVRSLIQTLKRYKAGFWADNLGWIFSAAIPDLFPPAALFYVLPQPAIKRALEKITFTVIWDGRLSHKDRLNLSQNLNRFAGHRSQLTQMKALSMRADIVQGIDIDHLALLKSEGVDQENIKTLILIKTQAFQQLQFLASHYNLPPRHDLHPVPKSVWRPLARYIYANYLLWNLGHPQQWFLQPLFFAQKLIKLYFTLMFYKAIFDGVIDIINRYVDEKKCLASGKKWAWINQFENYTCGICADLPVDLRAIDSVRNCFQSYLKTPREWKNWLEVLHRFNASGKQNYLNNFDLSNQKKIIQQGKLPDLLQMLKPKMPDVGELYLNKNQLTIRDTEAIANFIQNSSLQLLSFRDSTIANGGIFLLASAIRSINFNVHSYYSNIVLDFSGIRITPLEAADLVNALALSSKNSHLDLILDSTGLGDAGIQAMMPGLLNSRFLALYLNVANCNITAEGCAHLATQLLQSQTLIYLALSLDNNPIGPTCAEALAKLFLNKKNLGGYLSLKNSFIGDSGIRALATALQNSSLEHLSLSNHNASEESIFMLINALSHSHLKAFHYTDHCSNVNLNTSVLIPQLASALNLSKIYDFGWNNPNNPGWSDKEIVDFSNFIAQGIINLYALDLSYNDIGPKGMAALARALRKNNNKISNLYLQHNKAGSGVAELAENLITTNRPFRLSLSNNHITTSDINVLLRRLSGLKPFNYLFGTDFYLAGNPIGDEGAINLVSAMRFSYLESPYHNFYTLDISQTNISSQGARSIAYALIKQKHTLWIDSINPSKSNALARAKAATRLRILNLVGNPIGNEGASALCDVLPYALVNLTYTDANTIAWENCGFISSANSLHPAWPYLLLIRTYTALRQSIATRLLTQFNPSKVSKANPEKKPHYSNENSHAIAASDVPSPIKHIPTMVSIFDASDYVGNRNFIVNLNTHQLQENCVDGQAIPISKGTIGVRGSRVSNNVLIGGDNSLLDVSKSQGTNFLQAGNNNQLRLGFFSKDYILVKENQGTVQIEGFDSKDTLHIVSEQTVYGETSADICHNENLADEFYGSHPEDSNVAIIQLKGTTVKLIDTRCEEIENNIHINDPEAVEAAFTEVMGASDNTSSMLYTSLLGICDTFLHSVNQSAWLTAIPAFASEVLYRSGGYTRAEVEKLAEEIQTLLLTSFANSPHAMTASLLARCLATRLTHSPQIISTLAMGAGIVTSVVSSVLTTNASFGWIALQTGVALMGSVAGSLGVQKLPDVGRWGFNQATRVTGYLGSRMGFWQQAATDTDHYENVYDPNPLEVRLG